MLSYGGEFPTKDEIISKLSGASATEKIRVETPRYRSVDRSIKVVEREKDVLVVPRYIVLRLLFKINSTEFADHKSHRQLAELGLALSSPELATPKSRSPVIPVILGLMSIISACRD